MIGAVKMCNVRQRGFCKGFDWIDAFSSHGVMFKWEIVIGMDVSGA
jgi:hypothetical protein